MAMFSSN